MSYISEIYTQNGHRNQLMSFEIQQKGKSVPPLLFNTITIVRTLSNRIVWSTRLCQVDARTDYVFNLALGKGSKIKKYQKVVQGPLLP